MPGESIPVQTYTPPLVSAPVPAFGNVYRIRRKLETGKFKRFWFRLRSREIGTLSRLPLQVNLFWIVSVPPPEKYIPAQSWVPDPCPWFKIYLLKPNHAPCFPSMVHDHESMVHDHKRPCIPSMVSYMLYLAILMFRYLPTPPPDVIVSDK